MPIGNWKGSILKEYTDPTRNIYSHDDYISLVGTTEVIFINIPQFILISSLTRNQFWIMLSNFIKLLIFIITNKSKEHHFIKTVEL